MTERSKTEKVMIQEIYTMTKETASKVDKIERNLIGDKDAKIEGVYDKVARHEVDLQQYKHDKIKVLAGVSVITVLLTAAWDIIKKFWHQ